MSGSNRHDSAPHSWARKFGVAFRGIAVGMRGQSSFRIHLLMSGAVVVAAVAFRLDLQEWCLIVLCIALVMACELFNSSLELLAQAIDRSHNPRLGSALDVASGAVLVASIGAAIVGAIVFLSHACGWS